VRLVIVLSGELNVNEQIMPVTPTIGKVWGKVNLFNRLSVKAASSAPVAIAAGRFEYREDARAFLLACQRSCASYSKTRSRISALEGGLYQNRVTRSARRDTSREAIAVDSSSERSSSSPAH